MVRTTVWVSEGTCSTYSRVSLALGQSDIIRRQGDHGREVRATGGGTRGRGKGEGQGGGARRRGKEEGQKGGAGGRGKVKGRE